jgi:hypothetical protein
MDGLRLRSRYLCNFGTSATVLGVLCSVFVMAGPEPIRLRDFVLACNRRFQNPARTVLFAMRTLLASLSRP